MLRQNGTPAFQIESRDYYNANKYLTQNNIPVEIVLNGQGDINSRKIQFMTYHGSKGVDFDKVYMPFCEMYQHPKAGDVHNPTLFMVAMTRSRKDLTLSFSYNMHEFLEKFATDGSISVYTNFKEPEQPNSDKEKSEDQKMIINLKLTGDMDKGYTTLCLFRKDDVIDFFKNGKAFLHCPVLSETMTVEEIAEDAKNCDKLFDKANPIDYSIYYFILQFVSDKKKDKSAMVEIEELRGIFPLDNESYRIGLHLSPEIRLEKPIFQQAFYNFQKSKLLESSRSGVENIARIFDI